MLLTHLNRSLAAGIATGALIFTAQPVLAADGGTVTGVVSDASGKPVVGRLREGEERRAPPDLHGHQPGARPVRGQGPAARHLPGAGRRRRPPERVVPERERVAGGEDAKVGLFAHRPRRSGARRRHGRSAFRRRRCSRPRRTPTDLPAGAGKELVAEKCIVLPRRASVVVKRSDKDDWSHTVAAHAHPHGDRFAARSDRRRKTSRS